MFEKRKLKSHWIRTLGATALVTGTVLAGTANAGAAPAPKAPVLAFSPSSGDFGQVTVGQTSSTEFTLTNSGRAASSSLTVSLAGSSGFTVIGDTCSAVSLPLGRNCTVTVQFAPTSAGAYSGTLTATGDNSRPGAAATISLTGTGVVPGHLYWTTLGFSSSGTIMMAGLDGTNPQEIAGGAGLQAEGVAVDGNHLYWDNSVGGTVVEANLDGTNPKTIVSGQTPVEIAIDTTNGHLYWANSGTGLFGAGSSIMEANLDGSDFHSIANFTGGQGVAVSGTHLYWTQGYDPDNLSQPYGVMEANLDGTDAHVIAPNLQVFQLAADSTHLYWTGHNNSFVATVTMANLDGSSPQTVGTGNIISGVAVSSSNLYWSDINEGTVTMAGLDGNNPIVVASGQEFPMALAVG